MPAYCALCAVNHYHRTDFDPATDIEGALSTLVSLLRAGCDAVSLAEGAGTARMPPRLINKADKQGQKVSQSGEKRYDKSIPTARVSVAAEAPRRNRARPVGDGVRSGPGCGPDQDRGHRGSAGHRRGVDPAGCTD